jgi:hypothetical protein
MIHVYYIFPYRMHELVIATTPICVYNAGNKKQHLVIAVCAAVRVDQGRDGGRGGPAQWFTNPLRLCSVAGD